MIKKIALCGWFSVEKGQATSGDILCLNVIIGWLKKWNFEFEIIYSKKTGGKGFKNYPKDYFNLQIFICGPIDGSYSVQKELFEWFKGAWYFWSNSIINRTESMHNLNTIFRDGAEKTYPDFSLLYTNETSPFILSILRGKQKEYGVENCLSDYVQNVVGEVLEEGGYFFDNINTELDCSSQQMLRKSMAIERFISSADLIITTRLHGFIHGLRSGRLVIAIDQIKNGAKLATMCNQIDWPYFILAQDLTKEWLRHNIINILKQNAPDTTQYYYQKSISKLKNVEELAFYQLNKINT